MGLSLFLHLESERGSLPSQSWGSGRRGREPREGQMLHSISLQEIPVSLPFPKEDTGPCLYWRKLHPGPHALLGQSPSLPLSTQCPRPLLPSAGGLGSPGSNIKVLTPTEQPRLKLPLGLLIARCSLSLSVGISLPAISTKILSHSS